MDALSSMIERRAEALAEGKHQAVSRTFVEFIMALQGSHLFVSAGRDTREHVAAYLESLAAAVRGSSYAAGVVQAVPLPEFAVQLIRDHVKAQVEAAVTKVIEDMEREGVTHGAA